MICMVIYTYIARDSVHLTKQCMAPEKANFTRNEQMDREDRNQLSVMLMCQGDDIISGIARRDRRVL
jgi:hypothetical protein